MRVAYCPASPRKQARTPAILHTFWRRYYFFVAATISLHFSACGHQSRQDACFSHRGTFLPQLVQVPISSSLHTSTSPPQAGQEKYSGTGRMNREIPGHVLGAKPLVTLPRLLTAGASTPAAFVLPVHPSLLRPSDREVCSYQRTLSPVSRGGASRSSTAPPY